MSMFVNLLLKYFESHPDQVINLIQQFVQALINHLETQNSTPTPTK